MTTLHVLAGDAGSSGAAEEVITGLTELATWYDLTVVRAGELASEVETAVDGHLVLAASLPDEAARAVARWPAGRVHGLVLLADTADPTLVPHLPALAAWGVPTLVVAPADAARRAAGQALSAGIPDAVFVVTEQDAGAPEATTVHWVASFLSIVDGLPRPVAAGESR